MCSRERGAAYSVAVRVEVMCGLLECVCYGVCVESLRVNGKVVNVKDVECV